MRSRTQVICAEFRSPSEIELMRHVADLAGIDARFYIFETNQLWEGSGSTAAD